MREGTQANYGLREDTQANPIILCMREDTLAARDSIPEHEAGISRRLPRQLFLPEAVTEGA